MPRTTFDSVILKNSKSYVMDLSVQSKCLLSLFFPLLCLQNKTIMILRWIISNSLISSKLCHCDGLTDSYRYDSISPFTYLVHSCPNYLHSNPIYIIVDVPCSLQELASSTLDSMTITKTQEFSTAFAWICSKLRFRFSFAFSLRFRCFSLFFRFLCSYFVNLVGILSSKKSHSSLIYI